MSNEIVERYIFTIENGTKIERNLMMQDPRPDTSSIPTWLNNPKRVWDNPQDPIAFTGNIEAGFEEEAMKWLGL